MAKNMWVTLYTISSCLFFGHSKLVKILLLRLAVDLNAKNVVGSTAFHFTCRNGQFEVSELLIQKSEEFNIKLNTKDNLYKTALHYLCENVKDKIGGDVTALHEACHNSYLKIAEILIKNSAELKLKLNAQTKSGWTAFHFACANGHSKIVELILDNKRDYQGWYENFNLELENEDDDTGLNLAENTGKTDIVNLIKNKNYQKFFYDLIPDHCEQPQKKKKCAV